MWHQRTADIAIIGAGAAGLAAAIVAGEAAHDKGIRIVLLEGARRPGAKILVSGGGRCNVTNAQVAADDFCGGPHPIIRRVLSAFDVGHTIAWFASLGVPLKQEPNGKLFPTSDQARTVLDALLHRVRQVGVTLVPDARVTDIRPARDGFELHTMPDGDVLISRRVIVATGGLALPKSGSDGAGLTMMERLRHTIIPTTAALVPLILKKGSDLAGRLTRLSGVSFEARLRLYEDRPESPLRKLIEVRGAVLLTHFGISGPATLDISRHWLRVALDHPDSRPRLYLGAARMATPEAADNWLRQQGSEHPRRRIPTILKEIVPERLAQEFAADIVTDIPLSQLDRLSRRHLAQLLTMLELPVAGTRGYAHAEATAGGVDLREIDSRTMGSRIMPGLFLCGEIVDVDGRIGGFNFQWAWSSGHIAGRGAVASL